ncbi:MAG TPA: Rieske 2Fe-2S domain-containing protein [Pirellulaceae bacterium]|nr:Rieske 2Fe-2S domain-containing protein [Pirellulaceae bacterium]
MSQWIRLAAVSDCPPGQARELVAGERIVALFNVDGEFYALDGICPHQGGPLGKGRLNGCILTCPWHGWQYDVKTGQHQTNASICHPGFALRVDGDEIFVDLG